MRVAFAGTPPFAARALEAIAAAGYEIPLVLTQPDRPAGRGMRLTASAVANAATELGLRIEKPPTLKSADAQDLVRNANADVMVVAAYGLLLPQAVLDLPAAGCINIHASLLPRWRGAAPIQRAIMAGDALTGISIMRMEAGLDTGPVLLVKATAIDARESTGTLTERLAGLGAEAILEALSRLSSLSPQAQEDSRATYAAKIAKSEARIDWSRSSVEVDRLIRAFDPAPGAETTLGPAALKIWSAQPVEGQGEPGEVLEASSDRLVIACGQGALQVHTLQRPGGKRVAAADFVRGKAVSPGDRMTTAA